MSRCTQEELEHEWHHSVSVLSDIVGEPVTVASVPGGYYSEAVARVAARAGIRTLFTSEPVSTIREVDGCRVVGRYSVRASTPVEGVVELVARRPIPRMRQFVAWNGRKVAKAIGGETYLRLRRILLARE